MDIPSPSLPPVVPLIPQVPIAPFQVATSGKRLGNLFIDGIIIYIIEYLFNLGVLGTLGFNPFLANIIIFFAYFVGLESLSGKTIGKYVTRTRVIAKDGSEPDFNHIFLRTICRYVPFEAFSFLGGARPSGWHDRWSKTLVIEDKKP